MGRHLAGGSGRHADEGSGQSARRITERRQVGDAEDLVLNAQGVAAAEGDGSRRERGRLADRHEIGEDERALADVDRLVPGVVEDEDRRPGCDVDLRSGAAHGVAGDVDEAERIAVLAADVQDLSAGQGQARDLDSIGNIRAVIADVQVGRGVRTCDGDTGGVADQAQVAGAAVEQREHAAVADGHGTADEDRGGRATVKAG